MKGLTPAPLGRGACAALVLLLALAPLAAPAPAAADSLAWGPRIGAGIDPDQFLLGVQFRPGAISKDLYIQPNVQLGLGDHLTIVSFAMPLHYHFPTSTAAKPYAGGGFSIGLVDFDDGDFDGDGRGEDYDDSEFEASIDLVGGVEWRLDSGNLFFMELLVGLGDLHDLELMTGLMF